MSDQAAARPLWQRRLGRVAALAVVAVAVAALLVAKVAAPSDVAVPPGPAAEEVLDAALAAGQPVLGFYHSTTCASCIEMMAVIDEVYPQFRDAVALVDVDVYDARNDALVSRARIAGIPTLILYDRTGKTEWHVGVMAADQLREHLRALAAG